MKDNVISKLLKVILKWDIFRRSYTISSTVMNKTAAYDYCEARGLGLAMWSNAESYDDIYFLGTVMGNNPDTNINSNDLDTALNNENKESCDTNQNQSCDGKLIWRQTKNGPCKMFQAYAGHKR